MMKRIIEFSVAESINVSIFSDIENKKLELFLNKIYKQFSGIVDTAAFNLKIIVSDNLPKGVPSVKLGKDGFISNHALFLKTGHTYIQEGDNLIVYIPTKVKRGRVPFKRTVVGRHITDEIIEPLLQLILLRTGKTFVHASTIIKDINVGAEVCMGWRGTGKTHMVIESMKQGCQIWSDDLAIISSDGFVYPYPRPIRLYSYNLDILDDSIVNVSKLKRKARITPPWQPVWYLELPNNELNKICLNKLEYINNLTTSNIGLDAEIIMNFEQSFFSMTRYMLQHAQIFVDIETSVAEVVNRGISINHN